MVKSDDTLWKTVAETQWLQEALVIQSFLRSYDIEAFIPEEHVATINPAMTGMRVRVQVLSEDFEKASAAIKEANRNHQAEAPQCQKCGSTELKYSGGSFKNFLRLLFGAAVFVPVRPSHREKICKRCGAVQS